MYEIKHYTQFLYNSTKIIYAFYHIIHNTHMAFQNINAIENMTYLYGYNYHKLSFNFSFSYIQIYI